MEAPVKIVSQADFEAWVNEQTGVSDDPAVRGNLGQTVWLPGRQPDGSKIVGPT
jgi:hypothetical protein